MRNFFFQFVILIFVIPMFLSCWNTENSKSKLVAEKIEKNTATIPEATVSPVDSGKMVQLTVDDDSHYSIEFLQSLRTADGGPAIQLIAGKMILNQVDTVGFPEFPEPDQKIILTGRKANMAIALTVERIKYTSISYRIEIVEFGKSSIMENGTAHLGTYFYFGSETDRDDASGISYFSNEYTTKKDNCYLNIRIGKPEKPHSPLLAKIIKNCNGEIQDIGLDDFPVLVEK